MSVAVTEPRAPRSDTDPVSPLFVRLIPWEFARAHLIIGLGDDEEVRSLLLAERTDPMAAHNAGVRLGLHPPRELRDGEAVARLIDAAYKSQAATDSDPTDELEELLGSSDRDLLSTVGKAQVVQLVDRLLFDALGRHASDVHVQPLADRVLVRCRIDGVLHTVRELPQQLAIEVISRIKVMGKMDIAERRLPQDGRASVTIGSDGNARSIDLRISTLPTSYGERAVIRLLDSAAAHHATSFESLGMPHDVQERFLACCSRPNGMVLVTGPTGSGKTTTLYTTLRWLAETRAGELNVMTVEDPIEYELSSAGLAISQSQINTKKGVTFAKGLRHILRQDPDVVMVGEIRDAETARVAIQSSLTGHLVFSTLHTNDAPSAATRMIDLGVEPYLLGASLSAVLAQRLVRRVHDACNGAGCDSCFGSGYAGRLGVYELFVPDDEIADLITAGGTTASLRATARTGGMRTLHEEAERLVERGLTTRLEAERVTLGSNGAAS